MSESAEGNGGGLLKRALRAFAALFPERFLRDLSLQTTGTYVSTALLLVRGILIARLLGPASLGVYSVVGIVIAYAGYVDLGMGRVPSREIPLALGDGHPERAEEWRWYGSALTTASAAIAAVCLAGYVAFRWNALDPDLRFGLLTACAVLVTSAFTVEQQVIMRAHQHYGHLNALMVASAVVALVAGVVGAWAAGIRGVFIGQVVSFTLAAGVSLALGGLPRPSKIRAGLVWYMVKSGIPFALITLLGYNLINIDQIMLVALLSKEALGVYMPVLYAGSAVALFPNAVVVATGSRLIRRYGQHRTMESIAGLTWRPVQGLSAAMPVLCAGAWVFGPLGILWILPEYVAAIGPLKIYLVGVFFLGLNMGTGSTLFAINKHKYDIPVVLGCIAINVGLDILFVKGMHLGLAGIALGSLFTYFAFWIAHTLLVHHYFGSSLRRAVLLCLSTGWPGFALAAALVITWLTGGLSSTVDIVGVVVLVAATVLFFVRWKGTSRWTLSPREETTE